MLGLRASDAVIGWVSGVLAMAFVAVPAAFCAGPPIDWIGLNTFGHYAQTYSPIYGSGLLVIGEADVYHLHDGTQWDSGAGSGIGSSAIKSSISTQGTQIEYTLNLPVKSLVFSRIDYDSGEHSSYGERVSSAPLVLRATSGSKTANLSGYAALTVNEPANYNDDRFSYFNAPIGWLVPFDVTYTLTGTRTWSSTTMDNNFDYNLAGVLDFRNAIIPEPWFLPYHGFALLLMGAMRRRR
jgi:hypothetical protein